MDLPDLAFEFAKLASAAVISFGLGRVSKKRELMSADLEDRTKEFRDRLSCVRDLATRYWSFDQTAETALLGESIVENLHRMQRMRVHCSVVSRSYKSAHFRTLEDDFFEYVTGDDFQSPSRQKNAKRISRIKEIAVDLDFAALDARRADLFLINFPRR